MTDDEDLTDAIGDLRQTLKIVGLVLWRLAEHVGVDFGREEAGSIADELVP